MSTIESVLQTLVELIPRNGDGMNVEPQQLDHNEGNDGFQGRYQSVESLPKLLQY